MEHSHDDREFHFERVDKLRFGGALSSNPVHSEAVRAHRGFPFESIRVVAARTRNERDGEKLVVNVAAENRKKTHHEKQVSDLIHRRCQVRVEKNQKEAQTKEEQAVAHVSEHDGEQKGEGDNGEKARVRLLVSGNAVRVHNLLERPGKVVYGEKGRDFQRGVVGWFFLDQFGLDEGYVVFLYQGDAALNFLERLGRDSEIQLVALVLFHDVDQILGEILFSRKDDLEHVDMREAFDGLPGIEIVQNLLDFSPSAEKDLLVVLEVVFDRFFGRELLLDVGEIELREIVVGQNHLDPLGHDFLKGEQKEDQAFFFLVLLVNELVFDRFQVFRPHEQIPLRHSEHDFVEVLNVRRGNDADNRIEVLFAVLFDALKQVIVVLVRLVLEPDQFTKRIYGHELFDVPHSLVYYLLVVPEVLLHGVHFLLKRVLHFIKKEFPVQPLFLGKLVNQPDVILHFSFQLRILVAVSSHQLLQLTNLLQKFVCSSDCFIGINVKRIFFGNSLFRIVMEHDIFGLSQVVHGIPHALSGENQFV